MNIRFQTESLEQFLPEALPLLRGQWSEVGSCPQAHALDVDMALYASIEQAGALHITTARTADATLVGYAIYFVHDYPHVQQVCMAQSDALYLHPDYRKGFAGLRLLQAAEHALEGRGVNNIMQTCTRKKDFGVLLRRMGYVNTETVYRKEM